MCFNFILLSLLLVSPVINEDLVDKEPRVIKGQTATFDCPVYGIPFPTVTWQKDGANISTDDPRIRILSSGIQLQIFNTMESDTGIYSCTATNPAGSDSVSLDFVVHGKYSSDIYILNFFFNKFDPLIAAVLFSMSITMQHHFINSLFSLRYLLHAIISALSSKGITEFICR